MPENELEEFIDHVGFEIRHKMMRYGSTELTNDVHLFENLVQESLAEICKGINNFNPDLGTFKNWIDGLILNVIKMYFRNKQNKQSLDIPAKNLFNEEEEKFIDIYFSPEETLLKKEKIKYLNKAIRILRKENSRYYQVIYLRCFQGLTAGETADFINCSKEDVYRWLNRAIKKLHTYITELEEPRKYAK